MARSALNSRVRSLLAMLRDPVFIAEMEEANANEAAIVDLMEQIAALPVDERHAVLVCWARSDRWHAGLMLCTGWQGALAREAWKAFKRDTEADTPARSWNLIDHAVGRESIIRLLGLEGDRCASYATAAFKGMVDDDGRGWIAGAIGCPPWLDADRLCAWRHLDITDVILWDPRTGEGRIAGEHSSCARMTLPHIQGDRLTVFGDVAAFFQAWAAARCQTAHRASWARMPGEWAHSVIEPDDGGLPGALIIGSPDRLSWGGVTAATVVAGPGTTRRALQDAALRAARLPAFEENGGARG